MRVLVTGGAGYIGSHTVVELIAAGHQAVIIDNLSNSSFKIIERIGDIVGQEITFYEADCKDKNLLRHIFKSENIDAAIHFAAFKAVGESQEKPSAYYENNLNSLTTLLSVMNEYEVDKLVFSSSCTVYGQPDKLPVDENSPIKPAESVYGHTKQLGEQIIASSINTLPIFKAYSLRYFNPIGAHPSSKIGELPIGKPNNLVPFITQSAAGLRGKLQVFGDDYNTKDGSAIRDYIHVVDLAKAHVLALSALVKREKGFYKEVNLGTGKGSSVLEMVTAFQKVNGLELDYEIAPRRPGDVEQVWANADLALKEINWKSELDIEQSLRDAWNWQLSLKNNPINI